MQNLTNVQFLSPLNLIRCWNDYSAEWKKVRHEFSEPSVHDLRVAIRRMTSELEIAAAITRDRKSRSLIRNFKHTLRFFGPLRDIQVNLLRAESGNSDVTKRFSIFLREQEHEEIRRLRSRKLEKTRRNLRRSVSNTNQRVELALAEISRPVLLGVIQGALQKRFDAVMSAYAGFLRSSSVEDFHRMRIKFKRLRYVAEVARPVLGVPTKKQIGRMRNLQKIMGEIHDLQTYIAAIVKWSGRKVPVHLRREYDERMKAFNSQPDKFQEFTLPKQPKARVVKV